MSRLAVSIPARAAPGIAFEVLMDEPIDVATLLGELDVGNDKAVAELVVALLGTAAFGVPLPSAGAP